jgi:hypothetical protein
MAAPRIAGTAIAQIAQIAAKQIVGEAQCEEPLDLVVWQGPSHPLLPMDSTAAL